MKLALVKIGANISPRSAGTSGGCGEAMSVIEILLKSGIDVDVFTKKLSNVDYSVAPYNTFDIVNNIDEANSDNYDALLVMNGCVTFFGGGCKPEALAAYTIINRFKGKVFYILCDPNLLFAQRWNAVYRHSWGADYKKEDVWVDRKDIICIAQPNDLNKLKDIVDSRINTVDGPIYMDKYIHFDFEKFPLLTHTEDEITYNENPEYDLSYGGTFRGGKRESDMIKFYFGYSDDVKVEMFGKIEEKMFNKKKISDLRRPDFNPSVKYFEFLKKMNKSIATVIIGDNNYKVLDDLAQRIYECILAKNVVFIDSSYDYTKKVFKNKELVDFCYVSSREEVEEKLRKLKEDESFRKHIVELQIEDTRIDLNDYANNLRKIIESNI